MKKSKQGVEEYFHETNIYIDLYRYFHIEINTDDNSLLNADLHFYPS